MSTTTTAPADEPNEPTPAEMEAFNSFDPIRDIPSPVEIVGDVRLGGNVTMSSFSPQQQEAILARAGNDRSERSIQTAIHGFLLDQRRELLIRGGAGDGATQTQRTMLEQANRVRQLSGDIARIDEALADVVSHRTEIGEDGKAVAVPMYRIQGDNRSGFEAEKRRLQHEMVLIAGIEGERQITEANRADALAVREAKARIAEFREAEALAEKIARDERVQRLAQMKAKFRKDTNL